jgi:hypothetical protein
MRIECSRLTGVGYANATFIEIKLMEPNGELGRVSDSREMSRAWTAFRASL